MGRPIGDIIQATIKSTVCGQTMLNVLSYRVTAVSSTTDVQVEQSQFGAQLNVANKVIDRMQNAMSNEATIQEVSCQFIRDTRWARSVVEIDIPGGIAVPCATANVAATITKRTEYAGRWAVGSFHLGGVPNDGYDGGLLDPDYKDLVALLAAELIQPIITGAGGTYEPVLLHAPGEHGGYSNLTATEVQDTLRVMRRRTVGLGI